MVSCGVVVGWVLKATVDRGSDPACALCELPRLFGGNSHSDAAFSFCPDVRVHRLTDVRVRHRLPRWLGLRAVGGLGSWSKNKLAIFFLMDDGLKPLGK